MAMPTSAAASAGASLTPSPTIRVTPEPRSARTAATLSSGERSASTLSMPSAAPIASATSERSPVTITIRVMPASRRRRSALGVSVRMSSPNSSAPRSTPSIATNTLVVPS